MSSLLARIMLVIFMLPLAGVLYTVMYVVFEDTLPPPIRYANNRVWVWTGSGGITWAFVAVYWILVWRREVRWTVLRATLTFVAAVLVAIVGLIVALILGQIEREFGWWVGSVLPVLGWLILTIFIWKETPAERSTRIGSNAAGRTAIACPQCGYSLTGLQSTRCPECGKVFTLDELLLAARGTSGELNG